MSLLSPWYDYVFGEETNQNSYKNQRTRFFVRTKTDELNVLFKTDEIDVSFEVTINSAIRDLN